MEMALSLTEERAERLDALLSELSWSIEDLVQFIRERRIAAGAAGIHNVNGNAKIDVGTMLEKVMLRQEVLPLGLCHEIARYFEKAPETLFGSVDESEEHESEILAGWNRPASSPAPAGNGERVRRTRTKRAGGDPALIAARSAAFCAAITASGLSDAKVAKLLQPDTTKQAYQGILVGNWKKGRQLLPDEVIPALAGILNVEESVLRADGPRAVVPPVDLPVDVPSDPVPRVPEPEVLVPPSADPVVVAEETPSPSVPGALIAAAFSPPSVVPAQAPSADLIFIPVSKDRVLELLRASTTVTVERQGENLVCAAQVVVTPQKVLDLFT